MVPSADVNPTTVQNSLKLSMPRLFRFRLVSLDDIVSPQARASWQFRIFPRLPRLHPATLLLRIRSPWLPFCDGLESNATRRIGKGVGNVGQAGGHLVGHCWAQKPEPPVFPSPEPLPRPKTHHISRRAPRLARHGAHDDGKLFVRLHAHVRQPDLPIRLSIQAQP